MSKENNQLNDGSGNDLINPRGYVLIILWGKKKGTRGGVALSSSSPPSTSARDGNNNRWSLELLT
jgi:hypothetical protein